MATFTPTYSEIERSDYGGMGYGVVNDVTMDAVTAYPSGGFALSYGGVNTILGAKTVGFSTAAVGYVPQYNKTTGKLQVMMPDGTAAVLAEFSGTFATKVVFRLLIVGY